jgi:uncharacterized protein (TIGR02246 family)
MTSMPLEPNRAETIAAAYTKAWNTGQPGIVAAFFAADGTITINSGKAWKGRGEVAEMAAEFFADVPDLSLSCDGVRVSGDHVVYLWTFTGTHSATKHPLRVTGWEEWDLDSSVLISQSRGWFDADDYARQTTPRG